MDVYESFANGDGQLESDLLDVTFEFIDLTPDINKPLKRLKPTHRRLRYTCSTVTIPQTPIVELSNQYLAFGTTSGSIYVFRRHTNQSTLPLSASTSISSSASSLLTTDNSLSPQLVSNDIRANLEHHLTIIHEDLVGSISAVEFAPVEESDSSYEDNPLLTQSDDSKNSNNSCNGLQYTNNTNRYTPYDNQQVSIVKALLAIGTSKGGLMIVEIRTQANDSRSYLPFPFLNKGQQLNEPWRIIYQCKSFTTDAISKLRWDDSQRLFIVDSSGKMFVLYDINELSNLMLPSVPLLLFDLNGVDIFQFELCGKLLVMSTVEKRVYLFDLDSSELTQIGKQTKKKVKDQPNGVCIMCNWKMVETSHYQLETDVSDEKENDSDSIYDEPFYDSFSKTYQLFITEMNLFVTRPKWRLWVVDSDGNIQFTHQFKEVIENISSTPISGDSLALQNIFNLNVPTSDWNPTMTNFSKLYTMYSCNTSKPLLQINGYLVTYSYGPRGRIYVIDPNEQTIVAVSPVVRGQIVNINCVGKNIFASYLSEQDHLLGMFVMALVIKHRSPENRMRILSSLSPSMSHENLPSFESNNLSNDLYGTISNELNNNNNKDQCDLDTTKSNLEPRATDCKFVHVLRQYISLFADLESNTHGKCSCGLPLTISFDCIQQDFNKIQLDSSMNRQMLLQLLELAQSNGNWTLHFFLLGKLRESKLCLYFSVLYDDPRLIVRHQTLFGCDLLSDETLWIETLDYICHCLFIGDCMDTLSIQLTGRRLQTSTIKESSSTEQCQFCLIQKWKQENDFESIMHWFEHRFIRYCLLFCSPDVIIRKLKEIFLHINNINKPNTRTYWLSTKFYMHLFRFQLFNISIVNTIHLYCGYNIEHNKHISARKSSTSQGTILDLRKARCAFCNNGILDSDSRHRRKIHLFKTCGHVYHFNCILSMTYCTVCTYKHIC